MPIARRTLLTGLLATTAIGHAVGTPMPVSADKGFTLMADEDWHFEHIGYEPIMSDAEADRFWLACLRRINDPDNLALNHVRIEASADGTFIRSGWRVSSGIPSWWTA